jgi:hypothetical protein
LNKIGGHPYQIIRTCCCASIFIIITHLAKWHEFGTKIIL